REPIGGVDLEEGDLSELAKPHTEVSAVRYPPNAPIALGVPCRGSLGDEIVAAVRDAIRTRDQNALRRLEAAERLLTRGLGKPKETQERVVKPLELQAIEEMTTEQLEDLWRQLDAD